MTSIPGRAATVALIAALLLGTGAAARQPTPQPIWVSLNPAACDVEPRTEGDLRALLDAGLAEKTASPAVPPSAQGASRVPVALVPGEPVDAETLRAVTVVAAGFNPCSNRGDLPRGQVLMTDELAAAVLADLALWSAAEGDARPAPASLDGAARERVLARIAEPTSRSPQTRQALVEIRDARRLPSGCVRATVVWMSRITAPETSTGWSISAPWTGATGGTSGRRRPG